MEIKKKKKIFFFKIFLFPLWGNLKYKIWKLIQIKKEEEKKKFDIINNLNNH